jgi:hypothetical protein
VRRQGSSWLKLSAALRGRRKQTFAKRRRPGNRHVLHPLRSRPLYRIFRTARLGAGNCHRRTRPTLLKAQGKCLQGDKPVLAPLPMEPPIGDTSLLGLRLRRFAIESSALILRFGAGQSLLLSRAACQASRQRRQCHHCHPEVRRGVRPDTAAALGRDTSLKPLSGRFHGKSISILP